MADNITYRDGFFTVRTPAWHRKGNVLDHYPTRQEAKAIAHNWEPEEEPVYRKVVTMHEHNEETCDWVGYMDPATGLQETRFTCETLLDENYEVLDSHKIVCRDDSHTPIGVTSSALELVSNETMYDIMEVIQGEGKDVLYETGGSLKGGAKVWLLLKLADPIVIPGDPNGATLPYFALQNAHDGSGSFRGQSLMTRIVCDNTAQMADYEAARRGTEFSFNHTTNIQQKIELAKKALAHWRKSVTSFEAITSELIQHKVSAQGIRTFIDQFIPMPDPKVASDRVRENVNLAQKKFEGYLDSATCEGIKFTAHGLVQASIEYLNHGRKAHSQESLFKRAYLDRNTVVGEAKKLALSVN